MRSVAPRRGGSAARALPAARAMRRHLLCAPVALAASCVLARGAAAAEAGSPFVAVDGSTPPLVLADLQGRMHDLRDLRGRVVLVNFWATWCAPCQEEIPSLELLQARFAREPFTVLLVNYGESRERVQAWADAMAIDLPVLLDAFHRARYDWKVRTLPTTFIVDRHGRLRDLVRGAIDWTSDDAIERIRERMR